MQARPPVRPVKGQILELRPARRRAAPCERIVASERVYLVPREDRPPDRRRHGRGAGIRHRGHRGRCARAAARGLPAAARRRRDGAARGQRRSAARDPGQSSPDRPEPGRGPALGHRPLSQRDPDGAARGRGRSPGCSPARGWRRCHEDRAQRQRLRARPRGDAGRRRPRERRRPRRPRGRGRGRRRGRAARRAGRRPPFARGSRSRSWRRSRAGPIPGSSAGESWARG